jgi:hypothetical protein
MTNAPILMNSMIGANADISRLLGNRNAVSPQPIEPSSLVLPGLEASGNQSFHGTVQFNQPHVSKAAARLLAKTTQEKIRSIEIRNDNTNLQVSSDNGESLAAREKEFERMKNESERIKSSKTKVRVTLIYMKHLPKMDKFGKTDPYCIFSIDNSSAGGQHLERKSTVVKKKLDPEWTDEYFYFDLFDYPSQVGI